jgi:hypothetical protein
LPIATPHSSSLNHFCGCLRIRVINTMTSPVTPSRPPNQRHHMSPPQPSSPAPITPASPPSKRGDLKSWWKKFQVQSSRHQEPPGKRLCQEFASQRRRHFSLVLLESVAKLSEPSSASLSLALPPLCFFLPLLSVPLVNRIMALATIHPALAVVYELPPHAFANQPEPYY